MPYTTPTAAAFKAKFPTFAAVGDAAINAAIGEANASVDTSWVEADYQPAIMYLAAHIMTIDGVVIGSAGLGDGAGIISAGLVTDMKVGDVSVKLAGYAGEGGSGSSGYRSTPYGRRYLELLRRNHPAVALV